MARVTGGLSWVGKPRTKSQYVMPISPILTAYSATAANLAAFGPQQIVASSVPEDSYLMGFSWTPATNNTWDSTVQFLLGPASPYAPNTTALLGYDPLTNGLLYTEPTTLSFVGFQLRRANLSTGALTTLDTVANSAQAQNFGMCVDVNGNTYWTVGHAVRKITPGGVATTLAGVVGSAGYADGPSASARFNYPAGVTADLAGTYVYVADNQNNRIRRVDTVTGATTSLIGSGSSGTVDGTGAAALIAAPRALATDPVTGNFYVGENYAVRRFNAAGVITTLAGGTGTGGSDNATGTSAVFRAISGIAVDPAGAYVYVTDANGFHIRRMSTTAPYPVTTIINTAAAVTQGYAEDFNPRILMNGTYGCAVDGAAIYTSDIANNRIRRIELATLHGGNLLGTGVMGLSTTAFDTPIAETSIHYQYAAAAFTSLYHPLEVPPFIPAGSSLAARATNNTYGSSGNILTLRPILAPVRNIL
jgi:sugar lactone lactonase YvrE